MLITGEDNGFYTLEIFYHDINHSFNAPSKNHHYFFGVFIEAQIKNEPNTPCSILNQEKVHWKQIRRMGLIYFYINYLKKI